MNTSRNNITRLDHRNDVYKTILSWLRSKGNNSTSTMDEFRRDVQLFFRYLRNKELEELTETDIKIKLQDVADYQTYLVKEHINERGEKFKNSSIERKITAVRSLYNYFAANEYPVNTAIFKEIDKLPEDTKHYGFLSPDEAKHLAYLAATTEREKKKEKEALILLAASTSIRQDALISLSYSDIRQSEEDKDVFIIETTDVMDKGQPITKEIHRVMYEMLLAIKNDKYDDDKIFHGFDPKGLNLMMKRLCNKAGIDPRRNIRFHSLKKAGVQLANEIGGIHAAQHQAGHKNITTTSQYYLDKQKNIAGIAMFENIPETVFDDLTREEMLVLLKGIGNGVGAQIRRQAKKMIEERN